MFRLQEVKHKLYFFSFLWLYTLTFCTFCIYFVRWSAEEWAAQFGLQRRSCMSLCLRGSPCCWRWSEDRRGFWWEGKKQCRCQNTACDLLSHGLFMHITFSPPRKHAKGNEIRARVCFTLALKGKYSLGLPQKWRQRGTKKERRRDGETDRRRGNSFPSYESLFACTFISYQTWWENISMLASNGRIMEQQHATLVHGDGVSGPCGYISL